MVVTEKQEGKDMKKKTVIMILVLTMSLVTAAPALAADSSEGAQTAGTDPQTSTEEQVGASEQEAADAGYKTYSKYIRGAVVTKTATIYEKATSRSAAVKKLKFGGKMVILKGNGKWYKVRIKELYGYVPQSKVVRYNKTKKHIALTFDDGPSAVTTKTVLKALKENKCRATFFVLGSCINKNTKKIIKQEYELGCEIGNHSYSHPKLSGMSLGAVKSQLSRTDRKVKAIIGKKPTVCRAPYGAYNKTVLKAMARPNIFWSDDTLDWKHRNTSRLIRVVRSGARDGDIVLMHDIHKTTTAAVSSICKNLKKKKFEMVTVTELAAIRGKTISKGHTYNRF